MKKIPYPILMVPNVAAAQAAIRALYPLVRWGSYPVSLEDSVAGIKNINWNPDQCLIYWISVGCVVIGSRKMYTDSLQSDGRTWTPVNSIDHFISYLKVQGLTK